MPSLLRKLFHCRNILKKPYFPRILNDIFFYSFFLAIRNPEFFCLFSVSILIIILIYENN